MELTFSDVQKRILAWSKDHTPPMNRDEIIGGIVGELGELAQALRYSKQSRQGGNPQLSSEEDCIGDIVLFVARYCNEAGFDFGKCVLDALEDVEKRHYVNVETQSETPSDTTNINVVSEVIKDLRARDKMGRKKYCIHLHPFNGRNALKDAYEEALDLSNYLKQTLIEQTLIEQERKGK